MAYLNIVKEGDEVLRKRSRPVTEITPRILRLLDDMKETLHQANGVGLAAPQVGVLRRIALVETEEGDLVELINPEIIEKSEEHQEELEGCLSVPGRWGITDRPMRVKVRATDRYGKTFEVEGEGLKARAFCHEIDHLDGVLFTDNALRILTPEEVENL
ncbi:MAG: peptide deformylase [Clostridia bacterium]|nr:peptide deformylase [Clostridia bacterium]